MGAPDSSDPTIENLLDLHREIFILERGYWATFRAIRVPPSSERPHGIQYALSLHDETDERVVGYDNAHPITTGTGPARRSTRTATADRRHIRGKCTPYTYTSAAQLMADFWQDVSKVMEEDQ
jgi:hypothetical protein